MRRLSRSAVQGKGGSKVGASPNLQFVKSGCTLLDLVLGGGWPIGRIANIVGDKSTGKTLLAIEAAANFIRQYPEGRIWYRESESAFDEEYAQYLGMPIDKVKFWPDKAPPFDTVEKFYNDVTSKTRWLTENNVPGLYILDSLDALSDEEELKREIDTPTYGGGKARQLSTMFRKVNNKIKRSQMCLIIISQIRDKMGISFGRKTTRAGGRALDFYASQTLYLQHIGIRKKTRSGQKRATGVNIKAYCDKNKIGNPFRECEFNIRFGFGIEDLTANLEYLKDCGKLRAIDRELAKTGLKNVDELNDEEYKELLRQARKAVKKTWSEIETSFLPPRRKYL